MVINDSAQFSIDRKCQYTFAVWIRLAVTRWLITAELEGLA